ncbi:MAG TPA: hypothetical protein VHB98_10725, partial [Chloroflexota bacterium]|nr:hypothetical protein [Chloroflexota bacterium]
FDTSRHDRETEKLTVWIDARTHMPLQIQVRTFDYAFTQRVDRLQRIAPGTLPANFFDPPQPHTSFWQQALDWLHRASGTVGGS